LETYRPLMAQAMARNVKISLAADWHTTTAFLLISAVALFWAALTRGTGYRSIGLLLGIVHFSFAAIIAWQSYYWFADPLALPLWLLLAPIGIIAFFAAH
ncbi:MAG: hypothetical protein ACR2OX_05425, partial [Methyloligellaceae bacterium]